MLTKGVLGLARRLTGMPHTATSRAWQSSFKERGGIGGELGASATVDISQINSYAKSRPEPVAGRTETAGGRSAVAKQLGIDPAYYYRPGPWDEKDLGSLFDANKAWANKMRGLGFFEGREKGHAPKIL